MTGKALIIMIVAVYNFLRTKGTYGAHKIRK